MGGEIMEEEDQERRQKGQGLEEESHTRIVITKEAEEAISEVMADVNQGFEAGRATRLDVASFMLLWFKNHAGDDALEVLRRQATDDLSMLDAIAKKAKASGELPPEIKDALTKYFFGAGSGASRKSKKNLKSESIIDRHNDEGAA